MRDRSKLIALCAIAFAAHTTWSCGAAYAFRSSELFGGAIHRAILKDALVSLGLSERSIKIIGKGTDSQDVPFSKKFSQSPQNHCDDKLITAGRNYFRARIKQAVSDAEEASKNPKKCTLALYEFGEGMHTVQDFYSHANYLEWLLQNNKTLEPVDWDNMPSAIDTGYYFYQTFLRQEVFIGRARAVHGLINRHQQLHFHSAEQYESRKKSDDYAGALAYALGKSDFLHDELNKDATTTMEGKVIAPQYHKTFHQLARQLATADTARQWKNFEQLIRESYGEAAPGIIKALKEKRKAKDAR